MDDFIIDEVTGEVINQSSDFFSEETLKNKNFQELNIIAKKMENWIKNVTELNAEFRTQKQIAQEYQKQIQYTRGLFSMESKMRYATKAQQLKKDYEQSNLNALELLKEGYSLIHRFREIFTGQSIIYQILIGAQKDVEKSILSEAQLSLEELLAVTDKVHKTSEHDFAIYITQADIRRANLQKLGNISELDDHQNKLFNAIQDVWENPPKVRGNPQLPKRVNRGRVYEVYTKYKNTFSVPLNTSEKCRVLWSLVKARGENVQGWKQGDYEDKQLKAVLDGSTADLISMNSAKKVIQETIDTLRKSRTDKTKITNLIKIYTTKGINRGALKNIDRDIRDEILDYINTNYLEFLTK